MTDLNIEVVAGSSTVTVWFVHAGQRVTLDLTPLQALSLADHLTSAIVACGESNLLGSGAYSFTLPTVQV